MNCQPGMQDVLWGISCFCLQIGDGLPVAVALIAVLMGLNLLEVVPLRLPSLDVDVRSFRLPPALQAYLAGGSL